MEHEREAERLEHEADKLEQESEHIERHIEDAERDWQSKQQDSSVPGAQPPRGEEPEAQRSAGAATERPAEEDTPEAPRA